MARNEWERGTFRLPADEWAKFKKNFREKINAEGDRIYEKALDFHEKLVAASKGQRGFNYVRALEQMLEPRNLDPGWYISGSMFRGGRQTPLKPRRVDFPTMGIKDSSFENIDARVSFSDKTRTVVWNVDENNHACDHARESFLGKAFFSSMKKVQWARNTGGILVGNDEYNQDSNNCGDGANYRKGGYGPLGEPPKFDYRGSSSSPRR